VTIDGKTIGYSQFVAPALMAAAAMNGAVMDSTFNVFFKLKYAKTYDAVLATPMTVADVAMGEVGWALIRGAIYGTAFFVAMLATGLVVSPWGVLAIPAAVLVSFGFAGAGMAGTSFMSSWQDFDIVMVIIVPLFLFSATFYPLSTYPPGLRFVVQCTPLYQGVELLRGFCIGQLEPALIGHALYLALMGWVGLRIADRRLAKLLLP
jgi:lipooligosaccharide transport system permease protein